jgi:hypothetical protein
VYHQTRPPVVAVALLRVAEKLVPRPAREGWRSLWNARLENLWILAARGELPAHAHAETFRLCGDAVAAAFWLRFERARLVQWMRGPGFIIVSAIVSLALVAVLSRGFQATRSVILTAIDWEIDPRIQRYDPRADLVVAHFVPILLALTVGAVLVAIGRLSPGRYGWRYWAFLACKLLAVMVVIPLVWIEGNAALRAHLAVRTLGLLFGWLAWTLAFLGAFGCGVIWSFTDQRRRCPVCLRRLAMPVTLGSWASVFEPATTEMLCDAGHGALCVDESETGAGDRWIALDSTWRGL